MKSSTGIYRLDLTPLSKDPVLSKVASQLEAHSPIASQLDFVNFCEQAYSLWRAEVSMMETNKPVLFLDRREELFENADKNINVDMSFPTSWGGVVVTRHIHPFVEKYLVVEPGGFLALEEHSEKVECLSVEEGRGLLLMGQKGHNILEVTELRPGSISYFTPGELHCVIGTEGLVILERSIDPKGMDQDLIFIYTP